MNEQKMNEQMNEINKQIDWEFHDGGAYFD